MKKKRTKRRDDEPNTMTSAELRRLVERTTTRIWGAASTLENLAFRMDDAVSGIERTQPKREAQAVIDALLPDVRSLVLLMERYVGKGDDELRFAVFRIATRLGEE